MKRFLKSGLSLVLALTIVLSSALVGLSEIDFDGFFAVKAEAASESDLTFALNDDGESYCVTDCNDSASGELVIPSTYNGLPVTSIGDAAFYNCTSLTSVTIPDSVTSIDYGAFEDCGSLSSVTIPNSVTSIGSVAFWGCTNLTSITIPDSVTSIGLSAFYNCTSLTSITIPDSVTSIGEGAFQDCTSLESITIPDSVTDIGEYAFADCTSLTDLTIGNSVTSIGDYAFWCCTNLTSITIPDSVTSIGDYAFNGCNSLIAINVDANNKNYSSVNGVLFNKDKTVIVQYPAGKADTEYTIPNSVTSIGQSAFESCRSLVSVTIGNSVTSIGSSAFDSCESLTSITIPDSVTSIGGSAFADCTSLTSITIPNSVTSIGDYAFSGCTSLTSVTIPDSVTSIGDYAFWCCTNLTSVTIPNSVTSIGEYAFSDCTSLTSVTIPNSVTSIGYSALGYYYDFNIENEKKVNGFTIKGYKGSAAESYAIENGFAFIDVLHTHTSSDWIVDKKATCTEDGSKHKECPVCDEVLETETITKTGHKSSDWITDKKATASAAGTKHKECTFCGITLETATIPQTNCSTPKLTKIENASNGIKITWGKTSGADSYNIYRKTYSNGKWSGWSTIKTGATGTTYMDTTAKSGVYYIYTVRAKNEAGLSGYNSTGLKIKFLATPKLTSISNASGKVTVKWGKVTGASSYTVYRKTYSNGKWSSWSKIGTTKNTYYNDAKVSSGKYYKYTVRATSGDYSSYYNTSGLKIKYLAVAPLKSAVSQKAGVKVTWGKVTGAKGYEVYRKTYSKGKWSSWTKIKTVSSGSTVSYTDKTAKKGVTYKYTVRAISDSNKGSYNTSGLQVKDKY